MDFLAQQMETIIDTYLTSIDNNWQPSDLLPVSNNENFLQDVAAHMTNGSLRAATTAANDMTAEATRLYDGAAAAGKSSAKAVEAQIDAHPLMSLILAFTLGFVGSRLLPR